MSENTRASLVKKKMGFNQMRNTIYWLQRVMKQYDLPESQIEKRLLSMGRNIGASFSKEYIPNSKDPSDLIKELYKITLRSKVKTEQDFDFLTVTDNNSALCKYQYKDIQTPGCNVVIGMISEILERNGIKVKEMEINACKSHGDPYCKHSYKVVRSE
ncbi:hypothetical protein DSAG12_02084 [Promethearchaeum syntrophicum]|uniref:V4R domain protein n=1 Tax=Promethearchaeum syntrophicum TaxID=2594042 RepID=A0A5B9DAX8_9ARCH|nr:hypothetical protein [Candidatus Prometheoarchaeum syntrophicum]QEE16254.1 hypothetical protein DSAG12_02084 [Candidatus Prometheoarchaeum syntrophicum]